MGTGIVIKTTGSQVTIKTENNQHLQCRIRGSFRIMEIRATNPVTVGDKVEYTYEEKDRSGIITKLKPRKNYLIRRSSNLSREYQLIAANVDAAWLVACLIAPRTFLEFIDRFLITAEAYQLNAKIIFNKIDLHDHRLNSYMNELMDVYGKIGYECFAVSAEKRINLDILQKEFDGKINVISGNSGVGKSSILNAIDPELKLKTLPISDYHLQGKHSTTFPEMHKLKTGGFVIDTPGIRGFGVIDMDRNEIYHFFPEIFKLSSECRFSNCLHINEPGCAVKSAVEQEKIYYSRYSSYISLMNEENEKYR